MAAKEGQGDYLSLEESWDSCYLQTLPPPGRLHRKIHHKADFGEHLSSAKVVR